MPQKPNVVMILTDDQGYGDMACHGNPWLKTPQLDRLHSQSVRLTDFHVDPMCAPTRAALLTGRYSARTGVWSTLRGRYIMHRDEVTAGDIFYQAGYKTGLFGKWHLGDSWPYRPFDRGFEDTLSFGGGVVGEIPDHWDNDYFNAVYSRNGQPKQFKDQYCTDVWFSEAIRFITESKDKPFFCYVPTNAPHNPFDVDERYSAPYKAMGVPDERARFYGMIACIDENLGRLRQTLIDLGIADNTIILFMGDNGTSGGADVDPTTGFLRAGYNAGMRGKKCWSFEGGHRNACLIHWPAGGLNQPRDVDALCAHIDLLPTLMRFCNIDHAGPDFDGRDISPLLSGERSGYDDERVICVHNQQKGNPVKYKDCEVMTHRWRLAKMGEAGPEKFQLFDMLDDDGQTTDVSTRYPDVRSRLAQEYESWWDHISERSGQCAPIYVGGKENPVVITAHAWHGQAEIYNQWHVRPGVIDNGWWPLKVVTDGEYIFELRRWPVETNAPIRSSLPPRKQVPFVDDFVPGKALSIYSARITIAGHDQKQSVTQDDVYKSFRLPLLAGEYRLQTYMTDEQGIERGAYYVSVRLAE